MPPCWALPSITFCSSILTAINSGTSRGGWNEQCLPWAQKFENLVLSWWYCLGRWYSLAEESHWGWALGVGVGGPHSLLTLPVCSLCLVFVAGDVISASCCHSWLLCLSPLLWAVPLESEANIHLPLYIANGQHSNREETRPSHPLPFSALLGSVSFWDLGCHSWVFFLLWLEHTIKYGLTLRCVQMIFLNVL